MESQQFNQQGLVFIEEIAVTIAARDLSPSMGSQDFLKLTGITPQDWELSQKPVSNSNIAQASYTNGVSINAQPRAINFNETISGKKDEEIQAPKIASRYVSRVPHAEYVGLSFNPRILMPFPNNSEVVRKYITEKLLGRGPWKNIGKEPLQAAINLMYVLERCQLNLSVAEARVQQSEQEPISALLFSGNFNYNLEGDSSEERVAHLSKAIGSWKHDLKKFRDLIKNKFIRDYFDKDKLGDISEEESVFPMGTM